ncbi:iron-sulfur cluster-binding domain-containing protein [Cytophagales bacterium LB-30]|uniref:Iron-sulfur cluster-binding domain-containing protein n=1 Tax=Shiella aurantiaca TaxID=3058365 RepID=A0ABT8F433_9BACT|nr:iron-sulfur cluster-binding domain-containing protein [Shiella aurantiaca]MDN4165217.1 iron-sulfur cluster-binding domain-containing protein [Shiella aurantiaca]
MLSPDFIYSLTLSEKVYFGKDYVHLYFEKPNGSTYQAGQFITLFLPDQEEIRRSYSLSSQPEEAYWRITVKRTPNGYFSRLLFDLPLGAKLMAQVPRGQFVLPDLLPSSLCFIAAGSGISPVFPLVQKALAHKETEVALLYSFTTQSKAVFLEELKALKQQYGQRFSLFLFPSQPSDGSLPLRLSNLRLENLLLTEWNIRSKAQALFYLCGPLDFMRMVQMTLRFLGVEKEAIIKEQFTFPEVQVQRAPLQLNAKVTMEKTNGEKQEWSVTPNQSIWEAAKNQGIFIPYNCRAGVCAACSMRCVKGKVWHSANEVLTDKELAAGWILTCTAVPQSKEIYLKVKG